MSKSVEIQARLRTDAGKGASRRLRREGLVPGVVYGAGKEAAMVAMVHHELAQYLKDDGFYSNIHSLVVDGQSERVVLKDLQRHPSKPFLLHFDLQRVAEDQPIRIHVPLSFAGESRSPGVKAGGMVARLCTVVEISCLPKDLPETIEVDVSGLNVGDTLHLSGLQLPAGVSLPVLASGGEDSVVVTLVATRASRA